MIVVIVYGILSGLRNHQLIITLRNIALPQAVASISEMRITPDLVTVVIPDDPQANGHDIIVFVDGVFTRVERTPEVLQQVAEAVRDCVVDMLRQSGLPYRKVQVYLRSQYRDDGFAIWEDKAPIGPDA